MHFRDRGATVQLVRTTYNAETKRSKAEVVGRIPRHTLALSADVKAKLTPAEVDEVNTYAERTRALQQLRSKVAAHGLMQTISEAVAYAAATRDEAERDQLRALFAEGVMALRRASAPPGAVKGKPAAA
jgi:hypothetical protein